MSSTSDLNLPLDIPWEQICENRFIEARS